MCYVLLKCIFFKTESNIIIAIFIAASQWWPIETKEHISGLKQR